MRYLVALVLLFVGSVGVASETLWLYDKNRDGEGMVMTKLDNGGVVFALYTFSDSNGYPIPPVVSPPRPDPSIRVCTGTAVWFTGLSALLADGIAIGTVYFNTPIDYPYARDGSVSEATDVGTFLLTEDIEGYDLVIESNGSLPNLAVFNQVYEFRKVLVR